MLTKSDIIKQAQDRIFQKRNNAKINSEKLREQLYARYPRLREVEVELSQTGINLARVSILKKGDQLQRELEVLREKNLLLQTERSQILSNGNLPQDILDIKYSCEKCNDSGYCNSKICSCLEKEINDITVQSFRKNFSIELSSFSEFNLLFYSDSEEDTISGKVLRVKMKDLLEYCQKYANSFTVPFGSILMMGKTGLGKTHLAMSIAGEVCKKGYNLIFGTAQELLLQVEKEHFGKTKQNNNTLESMQCCDLLVIDDLGCEINNAFTTSHMYNIVNSRLAHKRPTIITTNLNQKLLESRYGDKVFSRLLGGYQTLLFLGNDNRSKVKKKPF